MKTQRLFILLSLLFSASPLFAASSEGIPSSCEKYARTERFHSCENARKFGLTLNAAEYVEQMAEKEYAAQFCEGKSLENANTASILAGGENFRALYEAHMTMLRERCVYDPDGWCRAMGHTRK